MTRDLPVSLLLTFIGGMGIGMTVMEQVQKYQEEVKVKETAEAVRRCSGYLVIALDGRTTECRMLMPQFIMDSPLKPSPFDLRKREIRRAIGG